MIVDTATIFLCSGFQLDLIVLFPEFTVCKNCVDIAAANLTLRLYFEAYKSANLYKIIIIKVTSTKGVQVSL